MTPERRLLLCVVLQAVAEQDPTYVIERKSAKGNTSRQERTRAAKDRLAYCARCFVESDEFVDLVRGLDIPVELFRNATPAQAWQAFKYISNPETNLETTVETLEAGAMSKVQTATVPACGTSLRESPLLEMREAEETDYPCAA